MPAKKAAEPTLADATAEAAELTARLAALNSQLAQAQLSQLQAIAALVAPGSRLEADLEQVAQQAAALQPGPIKLIAENFVRHLGMTREVVGEALRQAGAPAA